MRRDPLSAGRQFANDRDVEITELRQTQAARDRGRCHDEDVRRRIAETEMCSLRDTELTLVIAIVLVTIVVFAFLRDIRATLIPSVAVPVSILGQATGQASLPFFARLIGERKMAEFGRTVNDSVYRVSALSLLVTAWMMAAALPAIDLAFRRGRFTFADAQETATLFLWFSLSLAFWVAQGLYARAFYAAGNTFTPMVAGTVVTIASLPVYAWMFRRYEVMGLALASDVAIVAHTVTLAALLHRKGLVR